MAKFQWDSLDSVHEPVESSRPDRRGRIPNLKLGIRWPSGTGIARRMFVVFEVSFKGQQSELLTEYRQGLFYSELSPS